MKQFLRIYLLLLAISVSAELSFAQAWPEIGATWYFQSEDPFSWNKSYFHFECQKDTVVMGKTCRKIKKYDHELCEMMQFPYYKYEIAFTNNDSIYLLDSLNGKKIFQLYIFRNALKGDTWQSIYFNEDRFKIDTITFEIDSVDNVVLNGKTLKRHFISVEYSYPIYNGAVSQVVHIERIGILNYMTEFLPSDGSCDGWYATGLRCYSDSYLGYYNSGLVDTCDKYVDFTGVDEITHDNLSIFPNPFTDKITISSESALRNAEVSIRNSTGQLVHSEQMQSGTNHSISTPFPSGMYFIEIRSEGKILRAEKLIKY